MIDIQTALYNIMHSRHGRDVRQSLHDSIYQMNENANEALKKAKSMGVGTAVDSASSSTEGYVEGNLYLNTDTWDLWQCVGVNSWLNTGNVKGEKGDKGADGINNFVYIRYSAYYDGTDFTATPTASSQFIGLYYGTSATAPTNKQDYQWTSYVGSAGTNAYVYVRYSESPDGTNFVDAPTALTKYIGFYAGSSSSAPANKASYVWSMYVGRDGEGSGDMREGIYAPNATEQGLVGTVDRALVAKTAKTATDATNAENLKKSNGEILDVDTVSTKLQEIEDNRSLLDKVISPADSVIWNIGNQYNIGDACVYNNQIYLAILSHVASIDILPTNETYWMKYSLATVNNQKSNKRWSLYNNYSPITAENISISSDVINKAFEFLIRIVDINNRAIVFNLPWDVSDAVTNGYYYDQNYSSCVSIKKSNATLNINADRYTRVVNGGTEKVGKEAIKSVTIWYK